MELEDISKKWKRKRILDLAPLQRGFDLPNSKLKSGNYPVVYSNGILNTHNSYMVEGPGVVTGRSGTIGKVFFVENNFWPHNTTLWVTNFYNNEPRFIYYIFQYIGFQKFKTGTGVPTLNRNDVHSFEVSVPPILEEQQAIATALTDIDTLIASIETLIAKKKAIKQGAMQQLLKSPTQGGKRLPGFEGEWVETVIGNISNSFSGGTPATSRAEYYDGNIPWISSSELNKIYIKETDAYISQTGLNNSTAKLVEAQTILIAMYGATAGVSAKTLIQGAINQAVLAIIPYKQINSEFIFYFFRINKDKIINKYTQGGQPNLSGSIIKNIQISLPPTYEEQQAIAAILSDMDQEIEALEAKKSKYQSLKQGMMQELLTGKKRLI